MLTVLIGITERLRSRSETALATTTPGVCFYRRLNCPRAYSPEAERILQKEAMDDRTEKKTQKLKEVREAAERAKRIRFADAPIAQCETENELKEKGFTLLRAEPMGDGGHCTYWHRPASDAVIQVCPDGATKLKSNWTRYEKSWTSKTTNSVRQSATMPEGLPRICRNFPTLGRTFRYSGAISGLADPLP